MALDQTFAAAYIDNGVRHKIFGRTLRPFCLWHLYLLQALDSPLIRNGDISLFDLKTAIGICSLKHRNSQIKRPAFPLLLGVEQLRKAVDQFTLYIGDYLQRPEYDIVPLDIFNPAPPMPPVNDAPAVVTTVFHAAWGSRISVPEAWNMPIGQAYISEAMYHRQQGNRLDFFTDDEKKFQEEMKAAGMKPVE